MPKSFFVLSKENLQLAKDEISIISKTFDRFCKINSISNLMIVETKIPWYKIALRGTFVKIAGQLVNKMSDLLFQDNRSSPLFRFKTYACRVINISKIKLNNPEIEKMMGTIIKNFSHATVSLKDPEVIIYAIFTNGGNFFGFSTKLDRDQNPEKIMTYPHELDSKLCRTMINLAGLKEDQTICDPFCGTGTTLLEAESMGIHSIGIDYDKKMYHMSRENLSTNGFKSKVIHANYDYLTEIKDQFDGIVTDIPYGRASKTTESPEKLLKKLFSIIPKKKKVVIMCKKGSEKSLNFKPTKKYEIYRHKSLTRMILVK